MGAPFTCRHIWAHDHISLFSFWRPEGPLWAPRSVGPYGVGRAPTPLMHAPCGGMHMGTPKGCPLYVATIFLFVARPPFGLPALMGALKGTHMHHPKGGALMGHPKGCPICAPLRGAHYITRVRVCACTRVREALRGNLGHFTRDLGQN